MYFSQTLAFRVEWNGRGPFWQDKTLTELVRHCRKLTPHWKQHDSPSSTFLEHYCAMADSPYDNKDFDRHLSRLPDNDCSLGFGFLSVQGLREAFSLEVALYQEQFQLLLERTTAFRVRAYSCLPLALSATEVLFRWSSAELLDEAASWQQVLAL